ncbi:hypothetical protein M1615_01105, partial [Patescibacteria group bacterium]|nr:hypothetical protein [Patescibacteria group bacterium]
MSCPQPTPTTVPTAVPTAPPSCTVVKTYPQCGGTCNGTSYSSSDTVMTTQSSCSNGTTQYSCTDLGTLPGQCGNPSGGPPSFSCAWCAGPDQCSKSGGTAVPDSSCNPPYCCQPNGGGKVDVPCGNPSNSQTLTVNSSNGGGSCTLTITSVGYNNGYNNTYGPDMGMSYWQPGSQSLANNPLPSTPLLANMAGSSEQLWRSATECNTSQDVGCNSCGYKAGGHHNCNESNQMGGFAVMDFENMWAYTSSLLTIQTEIQKYTYDQGQPGKKNAGYIIQSDTPGCTINLQNAPVDCSNTTISQNNGGMTSLTTEWWSGGNDACYVYYQPTSGPPYSETHSFSLHYCGNGVCECGEQGTNPSGSNYCPQDCPPPT